MTQVFAGSNPAPRTFQPLTDIVPAGAGRPG